MNFERAVELDPRNVDILVEAASTLLMHASLSGGDTQLFRRAVAVAPHDN